MKYYADMNDGPVSEPFRQTSIKTENHLMNFYDYSWKDLPDTSRTIGEYIVFYQGGPIIYVTHVPGPVSQSSAESQYNAA